MQRNKQRKSFRIADETENSLKSPDAHFDNSSNGSSPKVDTLDLGNKLNKLMKQEDTNTKMHEESSVAPLMISNIFQSDHPTKPENDSRAIEQVKVQRGGTEQILINNKAQ